MTSSKFEIKTNIQRTFSKLIPFLQLWLILLTRRSWLRFEDWRFGVIQSTWTACVQKAWFWFSGIVQKRDKCDIVELKVELGGSLEIGPFYVGSPLGKVPLPCAVWWIGNFKRHLHNHCVWSCNLSIQGTNLLQSGCFCKIPMQCWLGGSSKRFPPISLHFGLRYFPHCRSWDGFPDSSSRFPDLISGISRAAVGAFQPPRPVWPAAAALAKPHFTAGHWESHCALFKGTLQHCIKYTELLLEFLSTPGYRLTCQLRWISTAVEKAAILPINAIEAYIAIYNIQYRVRNNRTISNTLY